MRYSRGLVLGLSVGITAFGGFAACVSDTTVTGDGGPDVTQGNDVNQPDTKTDSPVITDAEAGLGPAPTPDGSLAWLNRYNNNVHPYGTAFADLGVNESGGLTYIVAGEFLAPTKFNFGNIAIGPSAALDPVSGGVNSTGTAVWATAPAAGSSDAYYQALAVDTNGDIYVYGSTNSTSIKLKNTLAGPTSFVAKLTATGTPVWDHVYTQAGSGIATGGPAGITISGGKIIVALTYAGTLTYDTATTISPNDAGGPNADVFIASLDATTGATIWAGSFGSPNNDSVSAIAPTPQGDVVLTGTIAGTATGLTGAGMPLAQAGDAGTGTDLYVLKVDSTGKSTYGLVYGDSGQYAQPNGIAYRNGTVAVAAQFSGAVDFGKGVITSTSYDGVVFTIDETTKQTKFAAQLAGSASDIFRSVAIDAWGEVVAVGSYGDSNASAQLGAQALPQTSIEVAGMVLAKWDPSGNLIWSHGYVPTASGGTAPYATYDAADIPFHIYPSRVQTTSSGQIVVVGEATGGANFGKGYQDQVSTYAWDRCTCQGGKFNSCFIQCNTTIQPACCNTYTPGYSGDGIIGVWQP